MRIGQIVGRIQLEIAGVNWRRAGTAATLYTLLAMSVVNTALAAGPLENLATKAVLAVKIIVAAGFGWKVLEMLMKERFSMAIFIGVCGALVGLFLFGGEATYTWAGGLVKGLFD